MALSVVLAVGMKRQITFAHGWNSKLARYVLSGAGTGARKRHGAVDLAPHRAKVLGYIDSGVAQKATLRIDGRGLKVAGHEQGYFVGPTLFDHVTPAMTIYQEEILDRYFLWYVSRIIAVRWI